MVFVLKDKKRHRKINPGEEVSELRADRAYVAHFAPFIQQPYLAVHGLH